MGEPILNLFSGTQTAVDQLQIEINKMKKEKAQMLQELARLQEENRHLKSEPKPDKLGLSNIENHRSKDDIVKCFTGLPSYAHFLWLVSLMSPLIRGQANLTSEDQITMTLMKLKLNLTVQSLAFIFLNVTRDRFLKF